MFPACVANVVGILTNSIPDGSGSMENSRRCPLSRNVLFAYTAVAMIVLSHGHGTDAAVVALLHDVLEDTPGAKEMDPQAMLQGFAASLRPLLIQALRPNNARALKAEHAKALDGLLALLEERAAKRQAERNRGVTK